MALDPPSFARRRWCGALALAPLAGPSFCLPVAVPDPDARDALAWRQRAEAALAAGRPRQAVDLFERAARLDDASADAELGQVRAWLQAGDGAQARAWARLVAGEHADDPRAAAWARALEALARGAATGRGIDANGDLPAPGDALAFPPPPARRPLDAPAGQRFLPVATGLIDGPSRRLLLSPSAHARVTAAGRARCWVTDGTGTPLRLGDDGRSLSMDDAGAEPSPAWRAAAASPRPARAIAGRPVSVLHAPVLDAAGSSTGATAWPRLATGLLTWPAAGDDRLRVDLPAPRPADGAPVFDACGGWLGWLEGGALTPTPDAAAAAACPARAPSDLPALHDRWSPAMATVWRPA